MSLRRGSLLTGHDDGPWRRTALESALARRSPRHRSAAQRLEIAFSTGAASCVPQSLQEPEQEQPVARRATSRGARLPMGRTRIPVVTRAVAARGTLLRGESVVAQSQRDRERRTVAAHRGGSRPMQRRKSILLSTNSSRDRMDREERALADRKLAEVASNANGHATGGRS